MSLDKRVVETIKKQILDEDQDNAISEILIKWLNSIDQDQKDLDTNKIIQELLNKININK